MKVIRLDNPQTWNLYAYVTNDPETLNDPLGLVQRANNDCPPTAKGQGCKPTIPARQPGAQKKGGSWFHAVVGAAYSWAKDNGHPVIAGFLTRYMSADEAAKATGEIPNVGRDEMPRPTHFTRDEPLDSAKEASEKYNLPETPTHRATVPEERVPNPRVPEAGPTTPGGRSQVVTDEPVQVLPDEIVPLEPVDPIIIDPLL